MLCSKTALAAFDAGYSFELQNLLKTFELAHASVQGRTQVVMNGNEALAYGLIAAGVRFDLPKMSHLGMVSNASRVWVRGPNAPFRDFAQAKSMSRQMIWPATSPLDGIGDGAAFTCAALKLGGCS